MGELRISRFYHKQLKNYNLQLSKYFKMFSKKFDFIYFIVFIIE